MTTLNYHHLRYFWAVAHEGHLTRAARRLHVSQSTLSVQIQHLEDDLGHPLFERRGKQLLLTEAGRVALDHADSIFATGDELMGTLRELGAARRVLRVGAQATLSRNFQLGFLRPVLCDDAVEIVLRTGALGQLLPLLVDHQLDVVLANVAPPRAADAPWVAHALAEQPVSLVAHPRRKRRRRGLAQVLAEEPLVLPARETTVRAGFDGLLARLGVKPRIAAEVDDMAMLRLLAREDIGLSVVPPIVVKDELAGGALREWEQLPGLSETFFAVTLARRFPNPSLKTLLPPPAPKRRRTMG